MLRPSSLFYLCAGFAALGRVRSQPLSVCVGSAHSCSCETALPIASAASTAVDSIEGRQGNAPSRAFEAGESGSIHATCLSFEDDDERSGAEQQSVEPLADTHDGRAVSAGAGSVDPSEDLGIAGEEKLYVTADDVFSIYGNDTRPQNGEVGETENVVTSPSVLAALDEHQELRIFAEWLKSDGSFQDILDGSVPSTIFAPVNEVLPSSKTLESLASTFPNFDVENYKKQIERHHVIRGVLVDPNVIRTKGRIALSSTGGQVRISEKDARFYVNDNVPVSSKCRFGSLFKSLEDVRVSTSLLKASGFLDSHWGPITVFLFPDSTLLDPSNRRIPECVWHGFEREENRDYLLRLIGYMVVPGIIETTKLRENDAITPLVGPSWSVESHQPKQNGHPEVIVDGLRIREANVQTENGIIHVFDGFRPRIEQGFADAVYWTCVDEYLQENPSLVRLALRLVDSGRPLPKIGIAPDIHPPPFNVRLQYVPADIVGLRCFMIVCSLSTAPDDQQQAAAVGAVLLPGTLAAQFQTQNIPAAANAKAV
ncbi:hypothetical protein BESB_008020 [Besnoitia besnoiti]|uniref:FAS1 domain-containing protein n=1 Tax=Besnoitia besnoiti TaxID=94643 RepID=A0A2A9MQQ8_BESBE|nr:hypothetical protein BESB_008020 [Besnoitia besnoiti]PFH38460.1 hypothetical protein BESB_008020 [Besnoitia besnoiti]